MTVRITEEAGLVLAIEMLARDIAAGRVLSCSLHYEPTHAARLSVCYRTGDEGVEDLPGLPGVALVVDDDDEVTEVTKPCR